MTKALLRHPWRKGVVIKVPRVAPPSSKLVPLMRSIESTLGVTPGENGLLAIKSFAQVLKEILMRDPGRNEMPELPAFLGGKLSLPIVIQLDATGYGSQQFNTICMRS